MYSVQLKINYYTDFIEVTLVSPLKYIVASFHYFYIKINFLVNILFIQYIFFVKRAR